MPRRPTPMATLRGTWHGTCTNVYSVRRSRSLVCVRFLVTDCNRFVYLRVRARVDTMLKDPRSDACVSRRVVSPSRERRRYIITERPRCTHILACTRAPVNKKQSAILEHEKKGKKRKRNFFNDAKCTRSVARIRKRCCAIVSKTRSRN